MVLIGAREGEFIYSVVNLSVHFGIELLKTNSNLPGNNSLFRSNTNPVG